MKMKIALGADPFGLELKDKVKAHLQALGHEVVDLGGSKAQEVPYYAIARDVGRRVAAGDVDRGVLCCGSGMGVAIIANKVRGVYAAVCEDVMAARNARSINNANVLTLGGMITAETRANQIVDAFLETEFKSGWDGELRDFLEESMDHIERLEDEEYGQ